MTTTGSHWATICMDDLVYLFDRASVPFLLRRSDSRAGVYCLVGECYVYGMMNDEGARMSFQDEGLIRLH